MCRQLALALGVSFALSSGLLPAAERRTDRLGDPLPGGAVACLGSNRLWHGASIGAVALSPDGKVVASGGYYRRAWFNGTNWEQSPDRTIRLWDAATGKELRSFPAPSDFVTSLCFSPNGKTLAARCSRRVCIWDLATGREVFRFVASSYDRGRLQFSADGNTLMLTGILGWVDTWSLAEGGRHRHWDNPILDFRKGNCWGAALSLEAKLVVWRLNRVVPSARIHNLFGNFFETQHVLLAQDTATGQKLYEVGLKESNDEGELLFLPDGKLLAHLHQGRLVLREGATGKLLRTCELPDEPHARPSQVQRLDYTADGKTLAGLAGDGTVYLWETASGKLQHRLLHHKGERNIIYPYCQVCLSFAADGRTMVVAASTTVLLWDVQKEKSRLARPGHREAVERLTFSCDGRQLFSAADVLCTWRVADWQELSRRSSKLWPEWMQGGQGPIYPLPVVSADGQLFVVPQADGYLSLRQTATAKELRRLSGPKAGQYYYPVGATAFSGDGRQLLTLAHPKESWLVEVHDVASGRLLRQLELKDESGLAKKMWAVDLAASADGSWLAWHDILGGVWVADLGTVTARRRLTSVALGWYDNSLMLLALSQDGRYLASGRKGSTLGLDRTVGDHPVHVYELATGREVLRLDLRQTNGHPAPVACLAFSPNSNLLAIGRYDEDVVRVWEIASGQERHTFTGHASAVCCLAFSPNGMVLASGSCDTTILIWDLDGSRTVERITRPGAQELEALWRELGADAARAGQAVQVLARYPADAVPFLTARLRPAAAPAVERMARLIDELGDGRFVVREKAAQSLEQLHDMAEPALREAVKQAANLETRRRLERLLQKLQGPITLPAMLREIRGVEVLERASTAEARQVLQALAEGAPAARLTVEARAALRRLGR